MAPDIILCVDYTGTSVNPDPSLPLTLRRVFRSHAEAGPKQQDILWLGSIYHSATTEL